MRVLGVELAFVVAHTERLRNLSGWKSTHRVPLSSDSSAKKFVAGLAQAELQQDLDAVYEKLKQAFRFTRREIETAETDAGTGTIVTPFFQYSVLVSLNPQNPAEIMWTRTVDAIKNSQQISSPAFAQVFDGVFDTLELNLPTQLIIEDFIDAVEAAKIPELTLKYDREVTYCELQIRGGEGTVTLRSNRLSIVHHLPRKTQQLIASFDTVYQLVQQHNVPLFSFPDATRKSPPARS